MKGRYKNIIKCAGVVWFSIIFLSMIWLPVELPITAPTAVTLKRLNSLMTCLSIKSKRVCVEASPSPKDDSTGLWSSFIGIGPALTGLDSFTEILQMHPQIQVGIKNNLLAATRGGSQCCKGAELYFFGDDNQLHLGLDYYKKFFLPLKSGAKIAGESSPSYSDHPLVPYRVRAMLGSNVKLLFTVRDPVDALLSLYTLRQQDERLPVPAYFHKLIRDQRAYDECLETTITNLFRSTGRTSSTLYYEVVSSNELDIHSTMLLEETAMMCWNQKTSIRHHNERLQHYLYTENLMRWHAVFPNQVLCIWSDEFVEDGLGTINSVLEFLGVDLIHELPINFTPLGKEAAKEKRKVDFKKDLNRQYKEMCDYLTERNRGLEKLCPRKKPGNWGWCPDT